MFWGIILYALYEAIILYAQSYENNLDRPGINSAWLYFVVADSNYSTKEDPYVSYFCIWLKMRSFSYLLINLRLFASHVRPLIRSGTFLLICSYGKLLTIFVHAEVAIYYKLSGKCLTLFWHSKIQRTAGFSVMPLQVHSGIMQISTHPYLSFCQKLMRKALAQTRRGVKWNNKSSLAFPVSPLANRIAIAEAIDHRRWEIEISAARMKWHRNWKVWRCDAMEERSHVALSIRQSERRWDPTSVESKRSKMSFRDEFQRMFSETCPIPIPRGFGWGGTGKFMNLFEN